MVTRRDEYYFGTRDLLIMAAMAGLGGVASTAINALGDVVQAALGFAGTTQWAAGLHVVFLLLVVGLVRKGGAATTAGLLKGCVELLSGNTHGIIILLVDLAAGLVIDIVFAVVQQRQSLISYLVAGALAAAANVWVFQLFALAPEDLLTAVWGITVLAAVSGAVLGGGLTWMLLAVLARNGLVREQPVRTMRGWRYAVFLIASAVLLVCGSWWMLSSLAGPPAVEIRIGEETVYQFSSADSELLLVSQDVEMNGVERRAEGYLLRDVISLAGDDLRYGAVLITATDGYSFFVTADEISENDELLLAVSGEGDDARYEIVGARNNKAWVRNVAAIDLVEQSLVEVSGLIEMPFPYNPADWQYEMDNAFLDLGEGEKKYQGVIVADVLEAWQPSSTAQVAVFFSPENSVEMPLHEISENPTLRIWSISSSQGMSYALATEGGDILLVDLQRIEVR